MFLIEDKKTHVNDIFLLNFYSDKQIVGSSKRLAIFRLLLKLTTEEI